MSGVRSLKEIIVEKLSLVLELILLNLLSVIWVVIGNHFMLDLSIWMDSSSSYYLLRAGSLVILLNLLILTLILSLLLEVWLHHSISNLILLLNLWLLNLLLLLILLLILAMRYEISWVIFIIFNNFYEVIFTFFTLNLRFLILR